MKSENQETKIRGIALALLMTLPVSLGTCHKVETQQEPSKSVVFEGTVEKLAPDLGILSGRIVVYRLVKYRVERVCAGKYDGKEIVVDHLILEGKELEGVNVGDRVCVTVTISDKILSRYNAEGIRDPSEPVKTFFLGEAIWRVDAGLSCCGASRE